MRPLIISVSTLLVLVVTVQNVEGKMGFEQLKNAAKAARKGCQKTSGASDDIVDAAKNGEFPPVPELQCYFKCLFTKMKVIKNNQISWAAMNQQMDIMLNADLAERFAVMVENCQSKVTSEDICEAAYQYVVCAWDLDSSLYFFA